MANKHSALAIQLMLKGKTGEDVAEALEAAGAAQCVAAEWSNIADRTRVRYDTHAGKNRLYGIKGATRMDRLVEAAAKQSQARAKFREEQRRKHEDALARGTGPLDIAAAMAMLGAILPRRFSFSRQPNVYGRRITS